MKRFSRITQNDKLQRRINIGKDLIQQILSFILQMQDEFEQQFK